MALKMEQKNDLDFIMKNLLAGGMLLFFSVMVDVL